MCTFPSIWYACCSSDQIIIFKYINIISKKKQTYFSCCCCSFIYFFQFFSFREYVMTCFFLFCSRVIISFLVYPFHSFLCCLSPRPHLLLCLCDTMNFIVFFCEIFFLTNDKLTYKYRKKKCFFGFISLHVCCCCTASPFFLVFFFIELIIHPFVLFFR